MELPDDVLGIIRDFSRPITRPDWRTLHRFVSEQLHFNIVVKFNTTFNMALIYFIKTQSSGYIYRLDGGTIVSITTPRNRLYYT
jgi:hypothetical protein